MTGSPECVKSAGDMRRRRRMAAVLVAAMLALPSSLRSQNPVDSAGALEAVDRFFETFNSRDPELWASSLHYPHIRMPGVGKPIQPSVPSLSAEDYANRFDYSRIVRTGWDHTGVEARSIVHITSDKAHVAALYHRYNEEGDKIRTTRVMYLVTRLGDRWGVQARFAAGEPHETEADGRQAEAAALEAVDRYLNAFYGGDGSDWESTLRYPFVNVRVGGLDEIKTPEEAVRFDRSQFDTRLGEGSMTWTSLRVIQSGSDGVNVLAELGRRDASGQLPTALCGLYLVTNLQGKWGVIGRSAIAR
ncbi:hypothetical protein ACFL3B_01970 [Gemmatimonadota bacterium]